MTYLKIFRKYILITVIIASGFFILPAPLLSQVIIAPPLVVLDNQQRFGSILIANRSNEPQEVTISFVYGYPASDSLGNIQMEYVEDPAEEMRSAAGWVRAFPRQFVLQPMSEQTVRLTVRPPGDLSDGTYSTRIKTTSTPQRALVDTVAEGITTEIAFVFNQVTSLIYKHGNVRTGVEVTGLSSHVETDELSITAALRRTGNSPYLGAMHVKLRDRGGNVVRETDELIAVYFDLVRKVVFDSRGLDRGTYTAEITLQSERRPDIPANQLISSSPVTRHITIEIP